MLYNSHSLQNEKVGWPAGILWLLAGLSGGLLFLTLPKFNLSGLAWVALVPLLVALGRVRRAGRALGLGLLAGTVQFAGMLTWIRHPLIHYGEVPLALATGIYGLLAIFLALFVGLFAVLFFWAYRYANKWALVLSPCAWVCSELARNYLAVNGFPWGLLGYSQVAHLPLMQIADTTGIYGISFLIVLVNAGIAGWILQWARRSKEFLTAAAVSVGAIGLLVVYWGYGLLRGHQLASQDKGTEVQIACMQGNLPITDRIEPYQEKFYRTYPQMIQRALSSSRASMITSDAPTPIHSPNGEGHQESAAGYRSLGQAAAHRPLIILPESPTPFYFQMDAAYRTHMTELARQSKIWLLFNNTSHDLVGDSGAYFNSVYLLNPAGELAARYDKTHLVPFGEYVPLKSVLQFAGKVLREVSDFRPGATRVISDIGQAKFGAFICFEALFPELVREFPRQGAEFLVNITNDAWYGETAAPYQHFNMVIVRAIENRRYLVRATNSGISAIIDPYGRSMQTTGLFKEAILKGSIFTRNDLTFYTRFGDVFAWFCVIIAVGAPLGGYFERRRKTHD